MNTGNQWTWPLHTSGPSSDKDPTSPTPAEITIYKTLFSLIAVSPHDDGLEAKKSAQHPTSNEQTTADDTSSCE